MGTDLVVAFDIESGVWEGPTDHLRMASSWEESIAYQRYNRWNDRQVVLSDKITIPRYISVGLLPWETFARGCYQDPELAFRYRCDLYHFNLSERGSDKFLSFWHDLLQYCAEDGNILLLAHNANYDVNGILNACRSDSGNRLIDMTREFLEAQKGTYLAFPESVHDDKTFDITIGKHHIRLVDTMNLSPVGCKSLAQYGRRASAMYHKAYYKLDTYDYDFRIRSGYDISPTYREVKYTKRDLQLCLFAAMINIYTYRKQLWGRGQNYGATDFPFSATQRDRDINDGLYLQTHHPDWNRSQLKKEFRKRKKRFKDWCKRWGNPADVETYELFHKAGTGGIISVNESYVGRPVENVGSMDLSSSYPACAGDFWYPRIEADGDYTGPLSEAVFRRLMGATVIPLSEELRSGQMELDDFAVNHRYHVGMRLGFVCKLRLHGVEFRNFGTDRNGQLYWIPTLPWKPMEENVGREYCTLRDKVLTCPDLTYHFSHITLMIFLAFYSVESIEFLDGFVFEMRKIQPIIHDRFEAGLIGKQKAKQIRNDWESGQISDDDMIEQTGLQHLRGRDHADIKSELKTYYGSQKVPLNSVYGQNYRRILRDKRLIIDDEYHLGPGDYDPATTSAYPTGMYIAAYGQLKIAHAMFWAIRKRLPILYVHTDSLKIQDLTPELVAEYNELIKNPGEGSFRDHGIGLMDYEGSHDLAVVMGNMRIVCYDYGKGFDITMSGLNEQKAFPRSVIGKLDFFTFVERFLDDGHRYAPDEETASGKTSTDYRTAGIHIPGIGWSMQSIMDSEFVLNKPDSDRQRIIIAMVKGIFGEYHDAAYYAKNRIIVRSKANGKNEEAGK